MRTATISLFARALFVVCFCSSTAFAQVKPAPFLTGNAEDAWRLGIGAELAIPLGKDINNYSSFALGATARIQYDLKGHLSLMATSGYMHLFAKHYSVGSYTVSPNDYGIVPVKLGAKYFVRKQFYVSGEAGPGLETSGAYKSTKFIFAPGIGIVAPKTGIDVGLRYENYSGGTSANYGLVALRVAYGFKL